MQPHTNKFTALAGAAPLLAALLLSACATTPNPDCSFAQTRNLDRAFGIARSKLSNGCEAHFDSYLDQLLDVAEGDPQAENKRAFSEFLVWSNNQGLLSKRQAQLRYNRYFNVKFVSLMGDYNNCAHTCPRKESVLRDMESELSDKERGLIKISQDTDSYYRADRLFKESELVLEATCSACAAAR